MAAGNRTTTKSNVAAKNVPTVTNAILTDILNNDMNDSLAFRIDDAQAQNSSTTNITVDFTGKDRVDLTRTGGALNITLAGLDDGDVKHLLITKTAGRTISFVGATDVTPVIANVTSESLVLYEIIRKGSNYYTRAVLNTTLIASVSEHNALTTTSKLVVPGRLPSASTSQIGLSRLTTDTEAKGSSNILSVNAGGLDNRMNGLIFSEVSSAWNMDASGTIYISLPVGVTASKVYFWHALIVSLARSDNYLLSNEINPVQGDFVSLDRTLNRFQASRISGGFFDDPTFSSSTIHITFAYKL